MLEIAKRDFKSVAIRDSVIVFGRIKVIPKGVKSVRMRRIFREQGLDLRPEFPQCFTIVVTECSVLVASRPAVTHQNFLAKPLARIAQFFTCLFSQLGVSGLGVAQQVYDALCRKA